MPHVSHATSAEAPARPAAPHAPLLRTIAIVLGVALVPLSLLSVRLARSLTAGPAGSAIGPLPVLGRLLDFQLTESNGRSVSLQSLRDRIWIADFIFTNCAGPCPAMTAKMAQLQGMLPRGDDVRLVSFTVDPDRDTPEALQAYGQRHGADPGKWWFLTGDAAVIQDLAVHGFKVGGVDDILIHSTRFVLVDRQGRIRGYYDSEDPDATRRLLADLQILLAERPS